METKEYTYRDRSKWASGPWDREVQDKVQWQDEATGLPCLAVRGPFGAWCGYVGVPEGHSLFEVPYMDIDGIECHCGLTFSDHCSPNEKEQGICHIPSEGEADNVWWLGFDCAHYCDETPSDPNGMGGEYRSLRYVKDECLLLARQLRARDQ